MTAGAFSGQTNAGSTDVFVRKYDLDGNLLWTQQVGSSGSDDVQGVATSMEGATPDPFLYLVGRVSGALPSKTSAGSSDAFIRKYDADGNEVWTNQFGTSSYDTATGIDARSGNLYVTGIESSSDAYLRKLDFDGDTIWNQQINTGLEYPQLSGIAVDDSAIYITGRYEVYGTDAFVSKIDLDGNHVWTDEFTGSTNGNGASISASSSGIYAVGHQGTHDSDGTLRKYDALGSLAWIDLITGFQAGSDRANDVAWSDSLYVVGDVGGALPGQTSLGQGDGYLRKYDSGGAVIWTRQFGTSEQDYARAVAVDDTAVYLAGETAGAFPGQSSTGGSDAFLSKYDTEGNIIWTRQFGSLATIGTPITGADSIVVDASGIYVAGRVFGVLPSQSSASPQHSDSFVRKYDFNGNQQWTQQFGNASNDYGSAIGVDATGVYVTGLILNASADAFVRKFDPQSGQLVWDRQFGTSETEWARALVLDDTGVYVSGYTRGSLPGFQSEGDFDVFVRQYDVDGSELWTQQFGSEGSDTPNALAVGDFGLYVAGNASGALPGQAYTGSGDAFIASLGVTPEIDADETALTVDEGQSATNTGTFSSPDGATPTLNASIGTVIDEGNGTWSWTWDTADGPDDSQTVSITATHPAGVSATTNFDLSVENVPPVITGVGDTSTTPGSPITITADISDPGINDTLSIRWELGDEDNTVVENVTSLTHTYTEAGEYFASLTVTDSEDGVTVENFRVVVGPPVTVTATESLISEENGITAIGTEQRVNTFTAGSQTTGVSPSRSVASAVNGDCVVAWSSVGQDGDGYGVYAQRYDSSGNPLGGEFQVNTHTSGNQFFSSVAMSDSGEFVITWNSFGQDGDSFGVYAQRYDAVGNELGNEFRVNTQTTGSQTNSSVSIADSGNFVITWQSSGQDGSGDGVYGQRFDSSGNAIEGEFPVNSHTASNQSSPSVSMSGTGAFVVAWTSTSQDGDWEGVFAQRYDSNGSPVGGEFRVNTYTAGSQRYHSVSMSDSGEFVVAWTSYMQDGSIWSVYAQRYDTEGNTRGDEFRVNTYTAIEQVFPSVSMNDTGEFLVSWSSNGQDGSDLGVFAQAFDASGNPWGDEFQVNTYTAGEQNRSSVSMTETGEFVVVWSSEVQDGSDNGVYAQRFALTSTDVDLSVSIANPLPEDVVIPISYSGTAVPDVDVEEVGHPGMATD